YLARFERREIEPRAERFQHIGRTALRREGTVAVLDHRQAARRRDNAGGGGYVDRPRKVAAGASAVGEHIARGREGPRRVAQRFGRSDQLFGRLAAHPERNERGRHERFAETPLDEPRTARERSSGRGGGPRGGWQSPSRRHRRWTPRWLAPASKS